MDEAIRGYIEKTMDEAFKENLVESTRWIEREIPISSLRDLTLGYVVGYAEAIAKAMITIGAKNLLSEEDKDAIIGMLRRRFPEILQKIERELHT